MDAQISDFYLPSDEEEEEEEEEETEVEEDDESTEEGVDYTAHFQQVVGENQAELLRSLFGVDGKRMPTRAELEEMDAKTHTTVVNYAVADMIALCCRPEMVRLEAFSPVLNGSEPWPLMKRKAFEDGKEITLCCSSDEVMYNFRQLLIDLYYYVLA